MRTVCVLGIECVPYASEEHENSIQTSACRVYIRNDLILPYTVLSCCVNPNITLGTV